MACRPLSDSFMTYLYNIFKLDNGREQISLLNQIEKKIGNFFSGVGVAKSVFLNSSKNI